MSPNPMILQDLGPWMSPNPMNLQGLGPWMSSGCWGTSQVGSGEPHATKGIPHDNNPSFGSNPYKCIGFGDSYGPKPYKFIGFGDSYGPKPYKFIGFGDSYGPKPYEGQLREDGEQITKAMQERTIGTKTKEETHEQIKKAGQQISNANLEDT